MFKRKKEASEEAVKIKTPLNLGVYELMAWVGLSVIDN